jgi:hypothetical protein
VSWSGDFVTSAVVGGEDESDGEGGGDSVGGEDGEDGPECGSGS